MPSMEPQHLGLRDGRALLIREAEAADTEAALAYVERVASETTFLTMEPGELGLTVAQVAAYFQACHDSPNQLTLLAVVDGVHRGHGGGCELAPAHASLATGHRSCAARGLRSLVPSEPDADVPGSGGARGQPRRCSALSGPRVQ